MTENKVFQFKIILIGSKPPIWRRIQVPDTFTFKELHFTIQRAMGWNNCHLHRFEINGKEIVDTSGGCDYPIGVEEAETFIKDHFKEPDQKALYEYDFGDGWEHVVLFEKTEPAKKEEKYPKCLAGKRACPPEDCGGIFGYQRLLKIMENPSHDEYEEMKEWLDALAMFPFNPEEFSVTEMDENWINTYDF